jgi:hypothetical protein
MVFLQPLRVNIMTVFEVCESEYREAFSEGVQRGALFGLAVAWCFVGLVSAALAVFL